MEEHFDKESYISEDIISLIDNSAEESLYLEFKSAQSLANTDASKKEIAKDISSFANSDGGILIYGIQEQDHIASCFSFVDGNSTTKEWLEQVISSRIQRRISNLQIFPIRFENDISKTIYLVKIPQSTNAPHMASDRRFYKRFNFESVPMEEYEVRNVYNRKNKTQLEIADILISIGPASINASVLRNCDYFLKFQIRNVGHSIEERYKLEVSIPSILFQNMRHENPIMEFIRRHEGNFSIFSVPNQSPLFQHELTTVIDSRINVNGSNLKVLSELGIGVKLYYSNGIEQRDFNILNDLEYGGVKLIDHWQIDV